ncbi:DUF523 domain-containing protein [Burkholderia sp. FERM BP-3421]|uniref:DUF523 domain-containing protein n=1 Tax=Burkholderia sp. FERM BP-3421 TaxID=1494466 RepID=UPI00235E4CA8|nr:DUF523 domain-containing protein [Burkholderia sp. FERM BP-3421]WDD91725.1 DUF523 domain-containing protein [Burkholderia sp. FERM BP-3421]
MTPPRILVSACLLGAPVRYDGSPKTLRHPLLAQWQAENRLVPICPEWAGGMPTPRPPAEIQRAASGDAVLDGVARVVDLARHDVTEAFVAGARAALALAREHGCRHALLTDASPSCGSRAIYDGSFSGRRHGGAGVTAALLARHGIAVYAQHDIETLAAHLQRDAAG